MKKPAMPNPKLPEATSETLNDSYHIQPNQTNNMKLKLILLSIIAMPFWLNSCEPTEYHSVRVYQRTRHVQKQPLPSDDPRDFKPKERF
jgi:hypothetical protein